MLSLVAQNEVGLFWNHSAEAEIWGSTTSNVYIH